MSAPPSRWLAVSAAADAIAERPQEVRAQLQTLLEHFGPEVDPVDELEAWALRQLVRALVNSGADFPRP